MKRWLVYIVLFLTLPLSAQVDLTVQKTHSDDIVQLAYSPSGRYLASQGRNNEFIVWDLFHSKSITSFYISTIEHVEGMKFSEDETALKVKTSRTTFLYNLANESFKQENKTDSTYRKKDQYADSHGKYSMGIKKGIISKRISGKKIARYRVAVSNQKALFTAFDVSESLGIFAAVAQDEKVYIYDYNAGRKKKELKRHVSQVFDVCFAPNGLTFATAGRDRSIILWDAQNLTMITRLSSHIYQKKTAEFSHDGRTLFIGDELGYIYSIDLESAFPQIQVSQPNLHAVNKIMRYAQGTKASYLVATSNNYVYQKTDPLNPEADAKFSYRNHAFLESKSLLIQKAFKAYQEPFGEVILLDHSPDFKLIIYSGKSDFASITMANVETGKKRWFYNYYDYTPWSDIGFLSDSTFISTHDSSRVLFYWMADGKEVFRKTDTLAYVLTDFEVIGPDAIWLNTKHYGQFIYNPQTRIPQKVLDLEARQVFKRGDYIILETNSNALVFYDLKQKAVYHTFIGHKENVSDINFHPAGDKFVTCSDDGTVRLWSLAKKRSLVTIIPFKNSEFVFITDDNYYLSSRGAMDEIGFKVKDEYFFPEQFDLKYNRPDIVLNQMGFSDANLIQAYRQAYLKRLKKMNFAENQISANFHLPTAEIVNRAALPVKTEEDSVLLKLKFSDTKYQLDRINVWINDVAIHGVDGIDIKERKLQELELDLALELADGKNKIEISVLNQTGAESYKNLMTVEKTGKTEPPNLFMACIGTSKHQDSQYDLQFADKDARDMASTFGQSSFFGSVQSMVLTNDEVKIENLGQLKTFFNQAKINDVVILFIAGHGVLNAEFDYFFATHDIDFDHPAARGVSYESIEKLLDGIKALKKILFIDTCHSGELDKDEIEQKDEREEEGDIIFRSAGVAVGLKDNPLGLQSTNDLMKSLFTDLRKGTGATVISSSGGVELSIEGNNFKNGLFTYCLLNGLTTGEADLNRDKQIFISELQQYVQDEVNRLSHGRQTPTSRIQNNELNYRIW